jgi:hypothetical protein
MTLRFEVIAVFSVLYMELIPWTAGATCPEYNSACESCVGAPPPTTTDGSVQSCVWSSAGFTNGNKCESTGGPLPFHRRRLPRLPSVRNMPRRHGRTCCRRYVQMEVGWLLQQQQMRTHKCKAALIPVCGVCASDDSCNWLSTGSCKTQCEAARFFRVKQRCGGRF